VRAVDLNSVLVRMLGQEKHDWLRIYGFRLKEFLRTTTPLKLTNWVVIKAQYKLHHSQVKGMPFHYFIDPINVCNLCCPLCPTGRGILARPHGRMTLADLKRIIDEIAPYAYRVELYNWGEPLLHPEIFEMIAYASQRRITVGLSSNLNRLGAGMARQLVESGLSQLIVSVDGSTQESYGTYRRRGKLDDVLKNLRLLVEARQALRRSTPFIIARMLVGKHNEREIDAVRSLVHEIGVDSFLTGPLFVDTRNPEQLKQWVPENPAYSPYQASKPENTWDCHDLWESMVINWDGGVAPCCWLHDPQFDFGNVSDQTVREIWNGPNYISARRVIGEQHKTYPDGVRTICHRCRGHPDYMAY